MSKYKANVGMDAFLPKSSFILNLAFNVPYFLLFYFHLFFIVINYYSIAIVLYHTYLLIIDRHH